MKNLLLILFILLLFSCRTQKEYASTSINTEVSQAEAFAFSVDNVGGEFDTQYLQFLPANYEEKSEWPLLLFLHGAGERGTDLSKVAVQGPPKLASQGKLQEFVVIAPLCPEDDYWDTWQQQTNLIALLNHVEEELNIDKNRIYVTGLSMGGFGTWHLATALRDRVAAAVPVCGGGNVWTADFLKDIPIWAFHGAKDNVVPLSYSEEMVKAVNESGGNAKLTIFPEANHNSWDAAYEGTEGLYEWILSQSLEDRK